MRIADAPGTDTEVGRFEQLAASTMPGWAGVNMCHLNA
jgi:hypothetical protein